MKLNKILSVLCFSAIISSCNSILDLEPLDAPSASTFITTVDELDIAVNGAYRSMTKLMGYGSHMQICFDNGPTDIGIARIASAAGTISLGEGVFDPSNGENAEYYKYFYGNIQQANYILERLPQLKSQLSDQRYNEYMGEVLFLRAYSYLYMTELWGDVPYLDFVPQTPVEALLPRTSKAKIVEKMMNDLQNAADMLPTTWSGVDKGRITKGAALGLRARMALYNSQWLEAAKSAKAVMDLESAAGYALHPDYYNLFQRAGEGNAEAMLIAPSDDQFLASSFPNIFGSRNHGYNCVINPTQSLVDSYEATDGLPIDESAVYSPKIPFENRDPRLQATLVTPGSIWIDLHYVSHPDSAIVRKVDGTTMKNTDSRSVIWAANFCGYLWKKYCDEVSCADRKATSDIDFMLMRYAEILLIYAEAKIELGEIDQTMLDASINRVRARAYGKTSVSTSGYPRITTLDQRELRTIIKRERKVELANEGFRLFDIRRWRIAAKVMPVPCYGQLLDPKHTTAIPQIDEDGFVSYEGIESEYDYNQSAFPNAFRIWDDKLYLNPIPQSEIDTYKGNGMTLTQNPGY